MQLQASKASNSSSAPVVVSCVRVATVKTCVSPTLGTLNGRRLANAGPGRPSVGCRRTINSPAKRINAFVRRSRRAAGHAGPPPRLSMAAHPSPGNRDASQVHHGSTPLCAHIQRGWRQRNSVFHPMPINASVCPQWHLTGYPTGPAFGRPVNSNVRPQKKTPCERRSRKACAAVSCVCVSFGRKN